MIRRHIFRAIGAGLAFVGLSGAQAARPTPRLAQQVLPALDIQAGVLPVAFPGVGQRVAGVTFPVAFLSKPVVTMTVERVGMPTRSVVATIHSNSLGPTGFIALLTTNDGQIFTGNINLLWTAIAPA